MKVYVTAVNHDNMHVSYLAVASTRQHIAENYRVNETETKTTFEVEVDDASYHMMEHLGEIDSLVFEVHGYFHVEYDSKYNIIGVTAIATRDEYAEKWTDFDRSDILECGIA